MQLSTKSFATLVGDQVAACQASLTKVSGLVVKLIDFTIGSILRAVFEANAAAVGLWLQGEAARILLVTRAKTSSGADLDSWVADYGLTREPGRASTGLVAFSRYSGTGQGVVPVGTVVQSLDGSMAFTVYGDPTNPTYSATANNGQPGYLLNMNVLSVAVPVQANAIGAAGNVAAGAIAVPLSAIVGIDYFANAAPFTNGANNESDAQLRSRFIDFIASLAKATEGAIGCAINGLQLGMQWSIHEQMDPNGTVDMGMVTVFIDDGSGAPPSSLVTAANNAMGSVRAAGVRVGVYPATALLANVVMTIATAPGYLHPTVVGQVQAALAAFINAVGLEKPLPYTILEHVAYSVPGVINVTNVTLNGSTGDLTPAMGQTIKAGSVLVS